MSGYVRIHRSLIGHPAFRNDAEAMAFAWLVMRAAWKPARVRYKGKSISLDRGQLAISIRDMADALDRDKNWISRILQRMRGEDMIGTDAGTGVLVITIRKYDEYQSEAQQAGTPSGTVKGTDAGQTRDTEQGREEGKKEVQDASHPSPRTPAFPRPDWADKQVWSDFLANRKAKRLTNSATAYAEFLRNIAKYTDDEWPPGRLLEFATGKGWGSINNPREDRRNGTHQPNSGQPNGLRGSRPNPALDLVRSAQGPPEFGDEAPDRGAWPSFPAIGSG